MSEQEIEALMVQVNGLSNQIGDLVAEFNRLCERVDILEGWKDHEAERQAGDDW